MYMVEVSRSSSGLHRLVRLGKKASPKPAYELVERDIYSFRLRAVLERINPGSSGEQITNHL